MNNSSFSHPFLIDLNEDHHHNNLFSSNSSKTTEDYAASSSSNSISYPFFISPSPQDFPYYQPLHHQDHEVENLYASHGGSLTHQNESGNKLFVCKKEDRENGSVKWMSSKMRLMKKMMKSTDQTVGNTSSDQNSNSIEKGQSSISMEVDHDTKNLLNDNTMNSSIRVCADCNTTKTPLWRSGPRGPKSLCNACGIRQRKARRALAAAQESGNGHAIVYSAAATNKVMKNKDQRTANNNKHLPLKKRCKFTAQSRGGSRKNKLSNNFEDLSSLILSKNSTAFQQVFPQDEKEAAVLLMALSYGLVRD